MHENKQILNYHQANDSFTHPSLTDRPRAKERERERERKRKRERERERERERC